MRQRIESSIGDDAMEDCGFLKFTDENLRSTFLQTLSTMRKHRLFCDVVINVDNSDIHAHKNVLACVSPHLMELFSAEQESQFRHSDGIPSYRLNNGLTKIALQVLVDYAYTGVLEVPDVLVKDVYLAAWKLRIENIVNECARHLISELCADSCIEIRSLPGINKNKNFVAEVDKFISEQFRAVSQTSAFLQLPCATIDVLYQTKQEMCVVGDKSLCRLVLDWIKRQLTEDGAINMIQLLERTHLLYLAVDNSLQDCSDLPPGQESESDIVQDYKRLVLKCPNNKSRRKCLGAPIRPRIIIYSRDIGVDRPEDKINFEPDWNVIGSDKVGENTFITLTTLNGTLTRISIQLRLNLTSASSTPVPTPSTAIIIDPLMQQQFEQFQLTGGDQEPQKHQQQQQQQRREQQEHQQKQSHQQVMNQQKLQNQSQSVNQINQPRMDESVESQASSSHSTSDPETFHEVATMSGPKCGLGVAEWNGKLLVCGGYDRGECLKSVESYSPELNEWSAEANMREARGRVQIAVLNDIAYAVGGSNGTTELDTVECLRINSKKWEKNCKLPMARSNAGVCALNNKIYCIGGWNGQTGIKQCDVYQPEEDKWSSIAALQTGRYQAGVEAYKGKLWVAGGSDAWNCLASVEIYDVTKNQWSLGPSLLTARRGCGLTAFNGKLYAVGGSDGTHSLSTTEIYDHETKTWILGPNLTTPRANVSVLAVKGKLYAIGGFAGKNFLNTMEYLDETTNEWTTFVPTTNNTVDNTTVTTDISMLSEENYTNGTTTNGTTNNIEEYVNGSLNGILEIVANRSGSSDDDVFNDAVHLNGNLTKINDHLNRYHHNGNGHTEAHNGKTNGVNGDHCSSAAGINNSNNDINNHSNGTNNSSSSNSINGTSSSSSSNNNNNNINSIISEEKIQEKLATILVNKDVSYGTVVSETKNNVVIVKSEVDKS